MHSPKFARIRLCRRPGAHFLVFVGLSVLVAFTPVRATQLTYLGNRTIATGTLVGGVEFGGVSGIFFNPYSERFVAITDDSRAAGASRLWTIHLSYDGSTFTSASVESGTPLKTAAGASLPLADTEGIAGNLDGSFYISHEGLAAGTDPVNSIPPWIWKFDSATGNKLAEIALPVKFLPRDASGNAVAPSASNQATGVVSNLSLECLGISPSRKFLFTANEAALKQDYSGTYNSDTNQAQNSETRIVRYTNVPGAPVTSEEKVYRADQGTLYIIVRRFNTVPDILPIDDTGRMLVLERGLTQNNTNLGSYRVRIYEIDFNQPSATNVSGVASLIGATYTRLTKTLLWESSSNMDNVEAMCWGRDNNGFRTIVLASDNNFSTAQTTQFHVLLTDIPAVARRTLTTGVSGSGTVTASPQVAWYPEGAEVTLAATPGSNHAFSQWEGSASGTTSPLVVVMDASKSVTARFLSPYQQWKTSYFSQTEIETTELSWPANDPEGDGVPNLLEYALNLHPRQPSQSGLPELASDATTLSLTYRKDPTKPDVGWQVEVSQTLGQWDPVADSLIGTEGPIEIRKATVPLTNGRTFLRLKVTKLF